LSTRIGYFSSPELFILSITILPKYHNHKRVQLNSQTWINESNTYSIRLPEIPIPFESVVLILDHRHCPNYGTYKVDLYGLTIIDNTLFEQLLDTTDLYNTLLITPIEIYYSNLKSTTDESVTSLVSDTLTITNDINNILPNNVGNLRIEYSPNLEVSNISPTANVVTNIEPSYDNTLILKRDTFIKTVVGSPTTLINQIGDTVYVNSIGTKIFPADEVFLKGTLSKIIPNTINYYIEHPSGKKSTSIFKFSLPISDIKATFRLTYFGLQNNYQTQLVIGYCSLEKANSTYTTKETTLTTDSAYTICTLNYDLGIIKNIVFISITTENLGVFQGEVIIV
jgi:hypothetical protein